MIGLFEIFSQQKKINNTVESNKKKNENLYWSKNTHSEHKTQKYVRNMWLQRRKSNLEDNKLILI